MVHVVRVMDACWSYDHRKAPFRIPFLKKISARARGLKIAKSLASRKNLLRSGHFVAVLQTAKAAIMTATFPMASFREHSQTERTLASSETPSTGIVVTIPISVYIPPESDPNFASIFLQQ